MHVKETCYSFDIILNKKLVHKADCFKKLGFIKVNYLQNNRNILHRNFFFLTIRGHTKC